MKKLNVLLLITLLIYCSGEKHITKTTNKSNNIDIKSLFPSNVGNYWYYESDNGKSIRYDIIERLYINEREFFVMKKKANRTKYSLYRIESNGIKQYGGLINDRVYFYYKPITTLVDRFDSVKEWGSKSMMVVYNYKGSEEVMIDNSKKNGYRVLFLYKPINTRAEYIFVRGIGIACIKMKGSEYRLKEYKIYKENKGSEIKKIRLYYIDFLRGLYKEIHFNSCKNINNYISSLTPGIINTMEFILMIKKLKALIPSRVLFGEEGNIGFILYNSKNGLKGFSLNIFVEDSKPKINGIGFGDIK